MDFWGVGVRLRPGKEIRKTETERKEIPENGNGIRKTEMDTETGNGNGKKIREKMLFWGGKSLKNANFWGKSRKKCYFGGKSRKMLFWGEIAKIMVISWENRERVLFWGIIRDFRVDFIDFSKFFEKSLTHSLKSAPKVDFRIKNTEFLRANDLYTGIRFVHLLYLRKL